MAKLILFHSYEYKIQFQNEKLKCVAFERYLYSGHTMGIKNSYSFLLLLMAAEWCYHACLSISFLYCILYFLHSTSY